MLPGISLCFYCNFLKLNSNVKSPLLHLWVTVIGLENNGYLKITA
ncbi:MAG: hypothetical protein JWQ66_3009 [Mucilaginibacter sp.]|nr:hypothetical protein [Mucilaginibacter sp.]